MDWQRKSPDLTPLDFYVWGTMKAKVYEQKILSREHLILRINQAAAEMRNMNVNINRNIRIRIGECLAQNGGHFENLLH